MTNDKDKDRRIARETREHIRRGERLLVDINKAITKNPGILHNTAWQKMAASTVLRIEKLEGELRKLERD